MPRTLRKLSPMLRIVLPVGGAIAASLLLALPAAWIVSALPDPTALPAPIGEGILLLSAFGCAFFGAKLCDGAKVLGGLAAGGLYLLLPMLAALLLHGEFLRSVAIALIAFFFAALGALFGAKEKKRRRRR